MVARKRTGKTVRISAKAPIRIDLSGGTLDIWPLYLLLESPVTLNLGIDLNAEAHLTVSDARRDAEGIVFRSKDLATEVSIGWEELHSYNPAPAVALPLRLLRYFSQAYPARVPRRLEIETFARSPAGAGLGGSSALNVCLTGALAAWFAGARALSGETERTRLIDVARDCETQVLGIPAGLQDYYGAMFGGLQAIRWGVASHARKALPLMLLPELQKRLVLFYSGQSRNSGINNWALFKAFLDGDTRVKGLFTEIAAATRELEAKLLEKDWEGAVGSIRREWMARKSLATGISTAEIDEALGRAAAVAPIASKICGAGGGGCFFALMPQADPKARAAIVERVCANPGIRELPFKAVPTGLTVKVSG